MARLPVNKEESLALYEQGKETWNAWAEKMLAARGALKAEGIWIESVHERDWNDKTRGWHAAARTDFSEHEFEADINFSGFNFPGEARFGRATCGGRVRFGGAAFLGEARFGGATFSGQAWFGRANFQGKARFGGATFRDRAEFSGATFRGQADFEQATFRGQAVFGKAIFSGSADFEQAAFRGTTDFEQTTFSSTADFKQTTFRGATDFKQATFRGWAVFGEATFRDRVVFGEATISGEAVFGGAIFRGVVGFGGVILKDRVGFDGATFRDRVWFGRATFSGEARFDGATFRGLVDFERAIFRGRAGFDQSNFEGYASFRNAVFQSSASFVAVQGKRAVTLEAASFGAVPDFEQAHFDEAPRLDNIQIEPERLAPYVPLHGRPSPEERVNLAARWRALKRLAIQGHDHAREQIFFRGEIEAGRWAKENFWPTIVSYPYQWFSNFGASIFRPLIWWAASVVTFACLYLGHQLDLLRHPMSGVGWSIARTFSFAGAQSPDLSCVAGRGEPWVAAMQVSLRKGLLFLGTGASESLNQAYVCLYGTATLGDGGMTATGIVTGRVVPSIPSMVDLLGIGQLVISSVLIFLFLLAIRNHFRIK